MTDVVTLGECLISFVACGAAVVSSVGDQTGLLDGHHLAAILRSRTDPAGRDTIR